MKKLLAILLAMCMLLSFAACGGGDDSGGSDPGDGGEGFTIVNKLDCSIEEIHIVAAGAEGWGEDVTGYVDPGVGAYIYPQEIFGSSEQDADILVVDEYDNYLVFNNVHVADGMGFYVKIDDEGDALLYIDDDSDFYLGEIQAGDAFALLSNEMDFDIAELHIYPSDAPESVTVSIMDIASGDEYELDVAEDFENAKIVVDMVLVDEYGDKYEFKTIELRNGSEYEFNYDELENPILKNITHGGEYDSDRLEGGASDHLLSDLEGMWEVYDADGYILFYPDMTWDTVSFEGEIVSSGEYEFLGREVVVSIDGEKLSFFWDEDEDLYCEEADMLLGYVCDFESEEYQQFRDFVQGSQSHFENMGYEINYDMGEGGTYMYDGAIAYTNDGSYYKTLPVTVSIEEDSYNDTGDGYVEIEFTETAWLDSGDYPGVILTNNSSLSVSTVLCDYYTGYWLTEESTNGNSNRGDNYFYYEYESKGETVCVEYNYSTNWTMAGDGSFEFTKQYFVRMPADYDGLVYAHVDTYPDFDSYASSLSDPGDELGAIDDPRLENAIICRVNDI